MGRWTGAMARWGTLAACLAALPQVVVYGRHVAAGDYPGSAYRPRLEVLRQVSEVAVHGGPFVTVPAGDRYSVAAEGLLSDLGVPAIVDLLGRFRGRPAGTRALGVLNTLLVVSALLGLVFALPPVCRPGLIPLFLGLPLVVPLYRSPDPVAVHGAFAVIGVANAAAIGRLRSPAAGPFVGAVLFVLRKLRSAYGLYALAAAVLVAVVVALRRRDRRSVMILAAALATVVVLEVPWWLALRSRAHDPRVVERDTVASHQVYEPLVSGIGWTSNRWGIKPSDPAVATYVAERLGTEPAPIFSLESERRCRTVYLALWREAPLYLVGFYLARLPGALEYFFLRWLGALLCAVGLPLAASRAWRRGDGPLLAAVTAVAAMIGALIAQVVLIDTRYIYAYPLRFLSALGLVVAAGALIAARGLPVTPASETPAAS